MALKIDSIRQEVVSDDCDSGSSEVSEVEVSQTRRGSMVDI